MKANSLVDHLKYLTAQLLPALPQVLTKLIEIALVVGWIGLGIVLVRVEAGADAVQSVDDQRQVTPVALERPRAG